jgi:hypothetical protein
MNENLIKIRWNIDGRKDTYYDINLYHYPNDFEGNPKKLSSIKIVGSGNEVQMRSLTSVEVSNILRGIEKIKFKFIPDSELTITDPSDEYYLRLESNFYKLIFTWDSDGIPGNSALFSSLMSLIDVFLDIEELNVQKLGLEMKL